MLESIRIDLAELGVSQQLIDRVIEQVEPARLKCAIEAMQDKEIQFVDAVFHIRSLHDRAHTSVLRVLSGARSCAARNDAQCDDRQIGRGAGRGACVHREKGFVAAAGGQGRDDQQCGGNPDA